MNNTNDDDKNNGDIIPGTKYGGVIELFHDGVPYHIETSSLFCCANQ